MRRHVVAIACLVPLMCVATPAFSVSTIRVSVANDGSQATAGGSQAQVSANGRYVAFHSTAPNLVPGDTGQSGDVSVRDLSAGTTQMVSVGGVGVETNHGGANSSISADGRYVAIHPALRSSRATAGT